MKKALPFFPFFVLLSQNQMRCWTTNSHLGQKLHPEIGGPDTLKKARPMASSWQIKSPWIVLKPCFIFSKYPGCRELILQAAPYRGLIPLLGAGLLFCPEWFSLTLCKHLGLVILDPKYNSVTLRSDRMTYTHQSCQPLTPDPSIPKLHLLGFSLANTH